MWAYLHGFSGIAAKRFRHELNLSKIFAINPAIHEVTENSAWVILIRKY
jgi:hypothetical protein